MAPDLLCARTRAVFDEADRRAELDTESVAAYCDRRLNAEIRDHLLDPVLGGIFVVNGKQMSMADLWVTVWRMLLGGLRGYDGGIDFFARALAARLDVRTCATVTHVTRDDRGAVVHWDEPEGQCEERVDRVVIAVPAPQVPRPFPQIDPELQRIVCERLEQADYLAIRFALSGRPATRSLLTVAAPGELGGMSTVMYEHHLSRGATPDGKGLVGVPMYDEWSKPRLGRSDDELVAAVLPHLERVEPGITGTVEFAHVTRRAPAAVRLRHGTHRLIADIGRLIDPADPVQLVGDYLAMPSVNGSVISGEAAARRLLAQPGLGAE